MAQSDGRRERLTAYHEAGHAVAAVCLGVGLGRVTIVPDAEKNQSGSTFFTQSAFLSELRFRREGRDAFSKYQAAKDAPLSQASSGGVKFPALLVPPSRREQVWRGARARAEKYWMISMAGLFAEDKYTHTRCAMFRSENDFLDIENLGHWLSFDADEYHNMEVRLEKQTRKLVSQHWHEIKAVAEALLKYKELSGKQVRGIVANIVKNCPNNS